MKDAYGFTVDEKLVGIADVFVTRDAIEENARIAAWTELLKHQSGSLIDLEVPDDAESSEAQRLLNSAHKAMHLLHHEEMAPQLKALINKGIPSCIRGMCWRTFLDTDVRRISGYYKDLVNSSLGILKDRPGDISPDEIKAQAEVTASLLLGEQADEKGSQEWQNQGRKWLLQIEKDLPRTFPGHPMLSKASGWAPLRRILAAYALRNKQVGYCQSINFIAGCLLLFMDEEDAFYALCAMIEDILEGNYSPDMTRVQVDSLVFKRLVQQEFPAVSRQMDEAGADISAVCFVQWLLCLFLNALPLSTALRVWDVLLFEKSPSFIFKIALSLIDIYSPALHAVNDTVDAFQVLHEMAPMTFDATRLIHTANSSNFSHIDDKMLHGLRAELRLVIESPPKDPVGASHSSKPPLPPSSNEEASDEGVVSSLVKIGMNRLDQLRQRLEKGGKAATPTSLSPSHSFVSMPKEPYPPRHSAQALPDLMDFGDEIKKEGDGVLVIPEIDDLLDMPMEGQGAALSLVPDAPPPPPAPSKPSSSSSPPKKQDETVIKNVQPKTSDAARLALAIASTPFTPPLEMADEKATADWVHLSTSSLPPTNLNSELDDKDGNSNISLIAQAVKNAGSEAAKSIMNALVNVRHKGFSGGEQASSSTAIIQTSSGPQLDAMAAADLICDQLGIKDVLAHRSKLHEESQSLLMPLEEPSTLDHLSALAAEVVAMGSSADKALLMLADAQRRAEAEDSRAQELREALSSLSCVSELLDEQLEHLALMMVERNQMLEAMARKEGEATARLALQDGEISELRERNKELEAQLKCLSSQGGSSSDKNSMPWGRFFPSKT